MKYFVVACCCLLLSFPSFSQKKVKKLSKTESANLTQEQRLAHEQDRKTKVGKKKIDMQRKVKMSKRLDRKSAKIRQPKAKARKRKKNN